MIPLNVLPLNYQTDERIVQAFIAGGYVVCPALAGDIDIWVQVHHDSQIDDVRTDILTHLKATFGSLVEEETHTHFDKDDEDEYAQIFVTKKVAKVNPPMYSSQLAYHVLVTTAEAWDVIESFDISTSQVAMFDNGLIICGRDWTPVTVLPRIIRRNSKTPERLEKYTARFAYDTNYQGGL